MTEKDGKFVPGARPSTPEASPEHSADYIPQHPNSLNPALDHIPLLQEGRRHHAHTDAGRRSGRDDGPSLERHALREHGNDLSDARDQVSCVGVLAHLAVHEAADPYFGREGELVGSHNARPHRREPVQTLAKIPLLMPCLQISCADIVDDRVAENIVRHIFFAHLKGVLPDDHAQLALVIQRIHQALIGRNSGVRSLRIIHSFREKDRIWPLVDIGPKTDSLLGQMS